MEATTKITQVDGCDFTSSELEQFHAFCKYPWSTHSLSDASLEEKLTHYTKHHPDASLSRLQQWLESTQNPQAQLYERAKVEYYNGIEQMDYGEYVEYKESTAPKAQCPYQHLWQNDQEPHQQPERGGPREGVGFDRFFDSPVTADAMDKLARAVGEAGQDSGCHAVAVLSSSSSGVFLPALDSGDLVTARRTLRARLRLEIALRQLNAEKPLVIFANGSVHPSAFSLLQTTRETILSEDLSLPCALYNWAHLSDAVAPGTAEYALGHRALTIRGGEWQGELSQGCGFVGRRNWERSKSRILLAASCPPPHTRNALRQACLVESQYPGPCRIGVWKKEILQYFAPLIRASSPEGSTYGAGELIRELEKADKPWARKYVEFGQAVDGRRQWELWVVALRAARDMEYSQALALEYNLADALWDSADAGEIACAEQLVRRAANGPSLSEILGSADSAPNNTQAAVVADIPAECPFARMYRQDPSRFAHIDLGALSLHHAKLG
ncbi:hypothetical protein BX661DRAFT_188396 [Kickxella alabastrina]|uniref:uncharacterized protein n=1 Tax=Kickxella alabastrina TaxID=61397 RepID=UPI002220862F|nr:uncharacterized protein BX661DRAFT_188396 [Kickxella alabastrina]KAI7821484.1 hypothetical protein BX661DRAFT_188396 [Kickxella alabastrina]